MCSSRLSVRHALTMLGIMLGVATLLGMTACGPRVAPEVTSTPKSPGTDSAPPHKVWFEEVTDRSPTLAKFSFRNGEEADQFALPESLGGGVGVIDFDKDGKLDLVFTAGGEFAGADHHDIRGYPTRIFRNMGNFVFEDVTDQVLPPASQRIFYPHGVAVCDYDRDGWPDLLVTGWGGLALYHNEPDGKGGRKFVDVTEKAGLLKKEHFWATGAAFGDLDGDGWPDLYVCSYVDWSWDFHPKCPGYLKSVEREICPPKYFDAKQHAVFRNNGHGGFVDVSTVKETGLRLEADDPTKGTTVALSKKSNWCGKGLGVIMIDLDGDGRPEIFVATDTSGNLLFLNKSVPGQIRLQEHGRLSGVELDMNQIPTASMGVDAADIDGSGEASLFVTNFDGEQHGLYRPASSKNKLFYYHNTQQAGLAAIGQTYVGWGTGFVDLDNDGWMDILITNGHVSRFPPNNLLKQKPVLFRNKGNGQAKFDVITPWGGPYFAKTHRGRGLAIGDLDNDGRPDAVVLHLNAPPAVLHNVCDSGNHWLGVQLVGQKDDCAAAGRDVVGARAVLEVAGRKITQFQKGGGSYLSVRDPRLLFGLGQETKPGRMTVYWPSGLPRVEYWDNLKIDEYQTLEQGKGTGKVEVKGKITISIG